MLAQDWPKSHAMTTVLRDFPKPIKLYVCFRNQLFCLSRKQILKGNVPTDLFKISPNMVPTRNRRFDLKRLKDVIEAPEICEISTKKSTTYLELCGEKDYDSEDLCNDA